MTVSITLHNHDVCCVLYLEHYAVYSTAYYMITAYHDMTKRKEKDIRSVNIQNN